MPYLSKLETLEWTRFCWNRVFPETLGQNPQRTIRPAYTSHNGPHHFKCAGTRWCRWIAFALDHLGVPERVLHHVNHKLRIAQEIANALLPMHLWSQLINGLVVTCI